MCLVRVGTFRRSIAYRALAVFMIVFLCKQYLCVIIILFSSSIFKVTMTYQYTTSTVSTASHFSGDFQNFLQGLGSMVYKYKKPTIPSDVRQRFYTTTTTTVKPYSKNDSMQRTQKAVLSDILMMKLVSYYEDKYKITHVENHESLVARNAPATTETIKTSTTTRTTRRVETTTWPDQTNEIIYNENIPEIVVI